MNNVGDWFIEKLAGRGAADRLTRIRLEQQYQAGLQALAAERKQAEIDAEKAKEEAEREKKREECRRIRQLKREEVEARASIERQAGLERHRNLERARCPSAMFNQALGLDAATPRVPPWQRPQSSAYLGPLDGVTSAGGPARTQSYAQGQTHYPDLYRAQKSCPDLESASDRLLRVYNSVRPPVKEESVEPELMYPVPKMPPMEGWGKYRRGCSATEEWKRKQYNEDPTRTELWPDDGSNVQPTTFGPIFPTRKKNPISDFSSRSQMSGVVVNPEDGSIIMRGGFRSSTTRSTISEATPATPFGRTEAHASPVVDVATSAALASFKGQPSIPVDDLESLVKDRLDPLVPSAIHVQSQEQGAIFMRSNSKRTSGAANAFPGENSRPRPIGRRSNTVRQAPKAIKPGLATPTSLDEANNDEEDQFIDDKEVELKTLRHQQRRAQTGPATRRISNVAANKKKVEFRRRVPRPVPQKAPQQPAAGNQQTKPVTIPQRKDKQRLPNNC